ncbi:uncharacterized protein LOC116300531 [Actinia tenebrosa]|uniref:Uncharacterized protein LOC116300531 n=1 Tax=Actinia tenebrosa TaxID=6105 RepID=A0A6P8IF46_ACTTE|nr:uncharacterized protein LOC116300531 [Actinia tenebrosa]
MRDKETRQCGLPSVGCKTSTCNSLTMSQLTEHYKRKQRLNDEMRDKTYNKDVPRREIKRPYLLKLPKIIQQQQPIIQVPPKKESGTSKNQRNSVSELKLPVIKSENEKKTSTRNEYQLKDSSQLGRGSVNKAFYSSATEFRAGLKRETSKIDQGMDQNKLYDDSKGIEQRADRLNGIEMKIDCRITEALDNLRVPIVDLETSTSTNNGPKTISCNEYAKKMMLRKKKSWKDRRREAKLFDINLLNPQRAMLTSSATARGLKVLKANEVMIYRFCLSNYSEVDFHTVTE